MEDKPQETDFLLVARILWQQGMDRVHHSDRAFVAADDDCHTWAWFEIGQL